MQGTDQPKTRRASLGEWLTSKMGLQRMLLQRMNDDERQRPGTMYLGTADAKKVAKRRAKNRVARRSRAINRRVAKR